ncbi:Metallo-dependent phosphatase-like protein [Cerioporus squamosus]|nr:Metallo-dependent phosphatase-like protein [Cerioporus squamosus]
MQLTSLLALFLAALAVRACPGEDHDHAHAHGHERRAYPQTRLTPPTRPLVWGDVNIIHTTDSHGWLLGHQKSSFPEPNYSGDLGDFASFVTHMKQLAVEKDVDLLLVDSGDLHDGTGLSDGFPPGGVDGHESNKFLFELPYDIMAIGNHELYIYNNTYDMYKTFAPKLKGRYLSSNVNITVVDEHGKAVSVPVGGKYMHEAREGERAAVWRRWRCV